MIQVQNLPSLNIHSRRACIVLTGLPRDRFCNTKFWIIKILGRNRATWYDSNGYNIIIFGLFVVEIWTLEVSARKVYIFDGIHTSANFDANSNKWKELPSLVSVGPRSPLLLVYASVWGGQQDYPVVVVVTVPRLASEVLSFVWFCSASEPYNLWSS